MRLVRRSADGAEQNDLGKTHTGAKEPQVHKYVGFTQQKGHKRG